MSTTSKKPKVLSANSLTKLVAKHATRAQPAEKTSGTSRQTHKVNPELDTVPDQHNVLSDPTVTAEGYKMLKLSQKHIVNNLKEVFMVALIDFLKKKL